MTYASPYHNSVPIHGDHLVAAIARAQAQDEAVLRIMQDGIARSPSQVWDITQAAGKRWPLTSVRRSITNLEHAGSLVKTEFKREGPFGHAECVWRKA